MNWTVRLLAHAEQDLREARDWYEKKGPGLGDAFLDEVAGCVRLLEQNPKHQGFYYGNFRRIILRRFPYKAFYQVKGKSVVIFRVLHAKQDHGSRIRHPDLLGK